MIPSGAGGAGGGLCRHSSFYVCYYCLCCYLTVYVKLLIFAFNWQVRANNQYEGEETSRGYEAKVGRE